MILDCVFIFNITLEIPMNLELQNCSYIPQLNKLIQDKSIGMLTCLDYGGALVSKPIMPLEIDNNGAISFFIELHTANVSHLCNANLSFAEKQGQTYISLSGSGEINRNQAHIESLWPYTGKTWFPEKPRSINLALLKFSPYAAECWDVAQKRMVSVYSMSASVVSSLSVGRIAPTKINIGAIANLNCGKTQATSKL
jgi:general stress protein 26